MICERYYYILHKAQNEKWAIKKFEDKISEAVQRFILKKHQMSDMDLINLFKNEKIKWNRKHAVDYSLKKFRKYCEGRKNI